MSPISLEEKLDIRRVAVIGAGPCGLAAAKYLRAEKKFTDIAIFEQRAIAGGVWNYTSTAREDGFTLPRTTPTTRPDEAVYRDDLQVAEFVSPVYDLLETNIPHVMMNYTDQPFPEGVSLFPPHQAVLAYLQEYAEDLKPLISFQTQVLSVEKINSDGRRCWEVKTLDLKTKETSKAEFDAVAVASGHYNDPFVPDIPGLPEFEKAYPGSISHSKYYRSPGSFTDKKVIVVGNSASGIDVSAQISTVAKLPVFISEKEKVSPNPGAVVQGGKSWAKQVPEIAAFLPEERAVRFASGVVERDIDAVVFCTGYHYSFPFLQSLEPPVMVPDGSHASQLWEHILYAADPTLAFLSIPQRIVPFPVSEAQIGLIARIWADRLPAPPRQEMEDWISNKVEETGGGTKALHNLATPKDINYINRLYDRSMGAKRIAGLENDGVGKIPPYWGAEKAWTRERFPMIKLASKALGDKRHEVKTLKELGFDYDEWKKTAEAGEKLL